MAMVESATGGAVTAIVRSFAEWFDDTRCKRRLRSILRDRRYRFATIAHLAASSGASPDKARRLLRAIGARPSETDLNIWTLRAPRVL
ncbi:MAG TPA: hypothetical protein VFI48_11275 [Hyphomicrobiaceae bacterium]|nr:hypothetical protein [Hyphomicrobiaceae bacterium]